jgi:electron transfer flavoprotein alpha subunit
LVYSANAGLARELLTAAAGVAAAGPGQSAPVYALTLGEGCQPDELGGARVRAATAPVSIGDVAAVAGAVAAAARKLDCGIVLLGGDRRGKELAGRVGEKLGAGVVSGVTGFEPGEDGTVARRDALGGAVVERCVVATPTAVFAVAPRCFAEAPAAGEPQVEPIDLPASSSNVRVVGREAKPAGGVDVAAANVLVAVGCGFAEREAALGAEALATRLGGAVGCSKPLATDRGWLGEDRVIGISGKSCAPQLALLLGVSGQVQFWAGVRDAKTIIAVNTDEGAPAMAMADYSLVGDVREVLPGLLAAIG